MATYCTNQVLETRADATDAQYDEGAGAKQRAKEEWLTPAGAPWPRQFYPGLWRAVSPSL